ncbi:MAG TPA: WYL domain-containing protein [Pirellulales bacterium]|nr:WYL domain-containing protein [Pirellulales bacterium]
MSELSTLPVTVSDQDEIFDKIKLAIHDRVTIEFEYRELDDRSTVRVVNPHLLGLMDNTATMDAYQISGDSCEGRLPGWRRFRLANIVRLKRSSNRFEPRSEFKVVPRRWKGVFESVNRVHRHIAGKRTPQA